MNANKTEMIGRTNLVVLLTQMQLKNMHLSKPEVALLRIRLGELLDAMEDDAEVG